MPRDLITLPEAAERLGIPVRTAQHLAKKGRFPGDAARKVGNRWRVSVPLLDKYLHHELHHAAEVGERILEDEAADQAAEL